MEDIIADAAALGKKIAAHPRMQAFLAAAKAVGENKDSQTILQTYQEHVDKLRNLEMTGKPIEPADKHKLADCEKQIANNDLLKKMMKAQADYLEMMHRINEAIDSASGMQG